MSQASGRLRPCEAILSCAHYAVLCGAAADGLGVAFLPDRACTSYIVSGRLVCVFREWRSRNRIVHLVFTTRRGLPHTIRALIDHLAKAFPDL
ncbi:LysR substrate-binding domain-containing protein [Methylobacterium sp. WL6]|uniref:LysR substrate-binding domain-containing protein n=1 Tax=Methylobacterium sp. WL6 TaxID=2603901 RepID=UPI0011C80902|nr:LysR substrate-binding domain-containing protein [Methylobacterium sp. WL6]TXN72329.1 hypothetical protein FV230_05250 [Methylobacterium sp. WL6]